MLLRICLIVVLVAGLGALGLSFKVSERITNLTTNLADTTKAKETAEANAAKATKEATASKKAEKDAKAELDTTKATLATTTAKANEQEKLARELAAKLDKTTKDFNDADARLAQWAALGYSADQVRTLKTTLQKTTEERDVYAAEKIVLARQATALQAKLDLILGAEKEVKMAGNLKGKITAVDAKYGFVVLDIGRNQNLLERGKLAVVRQGKLVGKVKVTTLDSDRAIANVLPGWSQAELMEGDTVVTSYEALAQN